VEFGDRKPEQSEQHGQYQPGSPARLGHFHPARTPEPRGSLRFRGHHLTDGAGIATVNGMNFRSLLESHPEVTQDRHSLAFSREVAPEGIARAFARHGVVMLREALPRPVLETARCAFAHFLQAGETGPSNDVGSWHSPWQVRHGEDFPA